MIKSLDIQAVDTRTFGSTQDQQQIIGAVVHGAVEVGGISFTYSAQLNAIELTGLDGILLSVDRRMREALGLNKPGDGGKAYQPQIER